VLRKEQNEQYESIRRTALGDLETIDDEIASELARVKKRLLELQEDKKTVKQILDGATARLGMTPVPPLKELNLGDLSRLGVPSNDQTPAHSPPVTVP
jgi:hypothetical protein